MCSIKTNEISPSLEEILPRKLLMVWRANFGSSLWGEHPDKLTTLLSLNYRYWIATHNSVLIFNYSVMTNLSRAVPGGGHRALAPPPPIDQDLHINGAIFWPSSHTVSICGPPQSKILEPPMSFIHCLMISESYVIVPHLILGPIC